MLNQGDDGMEYPIIKRDKTRHFEEINGVMQDVEEVITMDYGRQGVSRVYFLACEGTPELDKANRFELNSFLSTLGCKLKN